MSNQETMTNASRVLYLDTQQATENLSGIVAIGKGRRTTDITFQLEESIVVPPHHTILLSVHSCNIPHSFYNFQDGINTTLTYYECDAGTRDTNQAHLTTYTLPEGNYDITTLLGLIKAEINGTLSATDFDCKYNANTLKCEWIYKKVGKRLYFDFRADQPTNFKEEIGFSPNNFIAFREGVSTEVGTGYNFYMDCESTLGLTTYELGYDIMSGSGSDNTNVFTISATPEPLPDPDSFFSAVDINYHVKELYLRTNITSHSVLDSKIGCRYSNILARIPITNDGDGGGSEMESSISISPTDGAVHTLMLKVREITKIFLRLTDRDNKLIDLNGLDWTLALQFDFIETPKSVIPLSIRDVADRKAKHHFLKSQGKAKVKELKEFEEIDENKKFLNV